MKNFILGVYGKIRVLGGEGVKKNQHIGGLHKKGDLDSSHI